MPIANNTVNALALVALPDAPIDPVTGLRIPTIAVATAGGISVIQHSGVVRNSSSTLAFNNLALTPALLTATRTADGTFYWAQNPGTLGASFALSTRTNTQAPGFGIGNTSGLIGPVRTEFVRRSATAGLVQKLRNHESDPARALASTITNTFNTGHQTGDIRRTYLADVGAGSATGTVSDRSYKAASATITGTLVKSEVSAAAQLVAYSGFSNANYLRESYSADLDFGAGEWSASAWANIPASIPTTSFPEIGGEIVVNGGFDASSDWTLNTGVTISGGALNFNNPAIYTGASQSIAASAATMRCYKLQVVVSSVTSGAVSAFIGNSGANENIQSGLIYSPGTYTVYGILAANQVLFVTFRAETSNLVAVIDSISIKEVSPAILASRQFSSGSYIRMGVAPKGQLIAEAFDGVTRRIAATTAAYNTATWAKAEACYTTDGTLAIRVNGVEAAATRGNPLLTLNNGSAVLTIGNSFALDAAFPGSIALLKLSATVPTAEQAAWMYEQEKHLFQAGAQCCLPDAGSIADLTYDEATDKWIAISATNESEWSGLVRTSVTPVPAGSYTRAAAGGGVQLLARSTTSPGVDVTIPAYGLREELVKRAEAAARLNAQTATYDYVGGFTANTTSGNTAILTIANLTYPTRIQGARVTGTGIPANATIADVSGTTGYLSAAATATGTAVQINLLDFALPTGLTATAVSVNGVVQREGPTAAYTRLFDGFREVIRFAVAPGNTAWVQIQTVRSAA